MRFDLTLVGKIAFPTLVEFGWQSSIFGPIDLPNIGAHIYIYRRACLIRIAEVVVQNVHFGLNC